MLAGAGLGDQPRLAHPPGEQRLAQHVVDLVAAGVVEVLPLEQQPQAELGREATALVEQRRPAGVGAQQLVQLGPEGGVGPRLAEGLVQRLAGGDERLGHELATEAAEASTVGRRAHDLESTSDRRVGSTGRSHRRQPVACGPAAASRFVAAIAAARQNVMRRRPSRRGRARRRRSPPARRPRRLDEVPQLDGVLVAGRLLDARRHVHTPGADPGDRLADVGRGQTARQDHAPVDRRAVGQRPVEDPPGARLGRVDEDRVDAELVDRVERRIAGGERLDHERDPPAHPGRVGRALPAVQLRGAQLACVGRCPRPAWGPRPGRRRP